MVKVSMPASPLPSPGLTRRTTTGCLGSALPARLGDNTFVPPLLRSLRPHQWTKNWFVFAPLVFGRALGEPISLGRSAAAFALFCALSSAVYLLNDLVDRDRDRLHPQKRNRPIASGTLDPRVAFVAMLGLAAAALAGAFALNPTLLALAGTYAIVNIAYSFGLKRIVIVDVMIVSSGYVLRVLAGGAAIAVPVSAWLLLCTIFLALFLALSKRRHELVTAVADASLQREVLGHYSPAFVDQMINVVSASTLLSYALYTTSPETLERFGSRFLLYTIPFVLFGIFRYLYLTYQVHNEHSPTEAMLTDAPFVVNLALWGIAAVAVVYWP